ncbi:hypothetical protein [Grimontia hollisae]|nr:hypothetical protein [Grimontia hollisae]
MVKVVFIVGLILIGFFATKFLDETSQKKLTIGAVTVAAVAVVILVIS